MTYKTGIVYPFKGCSEQEPPHHNLRVKVLFSDGSFSEGISSDFRWEWSSSTANESSKVIVAFKVLPEEKKEEYYWIIPELRSVYKNKEEAMKVIYRNHLGALTLKKVKVVE